MFVFLWLPKKNKDSSRKWRVKQQVLVELFSNNVKK